VLIHNLASGGAKIEENINNNSIIIIFLLTLNNVKSENEKIIIRLKR